MPLFLLVLVCAWRAGAAQWVVLTMAFQWQFFVNAFFHLATWVMFAEYSPGAVTGAVVAIPATLFFYMDHP
ncbi:HXXEE domain-containing protein [Mesorhizobium sp. YIM 152430]|nr:MULTISPECIES: HXXEE domain-containing protein [Hyphomicrobiales]MDF1598984.1 HXXEE domain-containing protein [Mesorhizobium sp. YIM 152430]